MGNREVKGVEGREIIVRAYFIKNNLFLLKRKRKK